MKRFLNITRIVHVYLVPGTHKCFTYTILFISYFYWHIVALHVKILSIVLLLSHFSRVWLCVTPRTAAHQAPPSLGFSRQEHWSGLPFSSPMRESEKWKWRRSVISDPQWPHGLQPSRLLHPWDFPGKSTGVGCHCLLLYCTMKWIHISSPF